jgi:hypothetical protein
MMSHQRVTSFGGKFKGTREVAHQNKGILTHSSKSSKGSKRQREEDSSQRKEDEQEGTREERENIKPYQTGHC